jgi:hypothetical protein
LLILRDAIHSNQPAAQVCLRFVSCSRANDLIGRYGLQPQATLGWLSGGWRQYTSWHALIPGKKDYCYHVYVRVPQQKGSFGGNASKAAPPKNSWTGFVPHPRLSA